VMRGLNLLEAAGPLVEKLLQSRRRTFRYCRYCRRVTPPEERLAEHVCFGCGSTWQGVVH
jgi:hypothetical protein